MSSDDDALLLSAGYKWKVLTFPGLYGSPRCFQTYVGAWIYAAWPRMKERRIVDLMTGKHVRVF